MRLRWKRGLLTAAVLLVLIWGSVFLGRWYGSGPLERDTPFLVPDGSTLTSVAAKLETEKAIGSASAFLTRAKILGGSAPIKAGEFLLPAHASNATIFDTLQAGKALRPGDEMTYAGLRSASSWSSQSKPAAMAAICGEPANASARSWRVTAAMTPSASRQPNQRRGMVERTACFTAFSNKG